jgi:hypothetical protein
MGYFVKKARFLFRVRFQAAACACGWQIGSFVAPGNFAGGARAQP